MYQELLYSSSLIYTFIKLTVGYSQLDFLAVVLGKVAFNLATHLIPFVYAIKSALTDLYRC